MGILVIVVEDAEKKGEVVGQKKEVVKEQAIEEKKVLSFNEWKNIDLRVGLIEAVEDLPRKDKLYKLNVDFSSEKRTVIAGIKPFYQKEELYGKKAIFVFNLAPAKLAGFVSEAMILGAADKEGKYKVFFADENVMQGTRLE